LFERDCTGRGRGKKFSDAIAKHPRVFPDLYADMVRAGETGGVLDEILDKLASMLEFQMKTKQMLKTAMRYPMFVIGALEGPLWF